MLLDSNSVLSRVIHSLLSPPQAPMGGSFLHLRDPDNYALSLKSQLNLGPITCQSLLDVGSLEAVPHLLRGQWPERRPGPFGTSARFTVATQVRGHTLKAAAAWNEAVLDSASSYSSAPRALSFDLRSPKASARGLSYRLGVYQVDAPASEAAEAALYAGGAMGGGVQSPLPLSPQQPVPPPRRRSGPLGGVAERGRASERGAEPAVRVRTERREGLPGSTSDC